MKELIAAGGAAYLMPAVLFALVLYAVRGLSGLHGRRSQQRKDFLDLWSDPRSQDDVWLEVAVRHLFGTYLPSHVIRLALAQPDKAQSLLDLSELWPLLRYDPDSQTVDWRLTRHATKTRRRLSRAVLFVLYVVLWVAALGAAWVASKLGHGAITGWVYGVDALLLGFLGLVCLVREDSVKTAAKVGDAWVTRINGTAAQTQTHAIGLNPQQAKGNRT